jgi:integrase/recombinase XerD
MWKLIREYAAAAGIEKKITPQILRNSFAVHMVQNGADLKSLQELLGHEDPAATRVYLSVSKNRIKDVYDHAHPRA